MSVFENVFICGNKISKFIDDLSTSTKKKRNCIISDLTYQLNIFLLKDLSFQIFIRYLFDTKYQPR